MNLFVIGVLSSVNFILSKLKRRNSMAIMFIWMKCFVRLMVSVFIYGERYIRMVKRSICWFKKKETVKPQQDLLKIRKSVKQPISKVVTDKLKSYIKPIKTLLLRTPHITEQYANNRAENSHQQTRLREKKMRKSKSLKQAQLFLSCFYNICIHFNCGRHLCSAINFRILVERRFKEWDTITQVTSKIQN